MAVAVSLSHAAVVHHEEIDLQLVGAGAPDVVVLRADEVNHLDTATFARGGGRHRALKLSTSFSFSVLVVVYIPLTTTKHINLKTFYMKQYRSSLR